MQAPFFEFCVYVVVVLVATVLILAKYTALIAIPSSYENEVLLISCPQALFVSLCLNACAM